METLQQFKDYCKKQQHLSHAAAIMHWDMATTMPKKGIDAHIEALTYISSEAFKMSVSEEMKNYLEILSDEKVLVTLDEVSRKMVEKVKKDYDENKNIPQKLQERLTQLRSKSQHVWQTAKHANDFETMAPYFEEMIQLIKEKISYTNPGEDTYDVLLNNYEKGMNAEKIAAVFKDLRDGTVPLIEAIKAKGSFDDSKMMGQFSKIDQQKLSNYLMDVLGYDLEAGVLAESEHPFTLGQAPYDVRMTTNYDLTDIRPSAFSVLHEGGHAIYEQNIDPQLIGTFLNTGTSMGIHESQSRFYENIIGRNYCFWEKHYGELQSIFEHFKDIDVDYFYRAINKVEPSLIRIEADELTYNMHVIIRFELERALFDGSLAVKDLPAAWSDKMKAYLGVEPKNHTEGVLQDVHWPGGMFGYFPSYALGNIYGGQFLQQMERELGGIDTLIEQNQMDEITAWLKKNIHQYGEMKTPAQIIQDVCGTGVDATPIIEYYKKKYTKMYDVE